MIYGLLVVLVETHSLDNIRETVTGFLAILAFGLIIGYICYLPAILLSVILGIYYYRKDYLNPWLWSFTGLFLTCLNSYIFFNLMYFAIPASIFASLYSLKKLKNLKYKKA